MKKSIRYPVAFDMVPPRHNQTKTVIAFVEGEVSYPEIESRDAPIAITVQDDDDGQLPGGVSEYRFHENRFLIDTGIRPREFAKDETSSLDRRGSLILPALDKMAKLYGDHVHLFPPKAMHVVQNLMHIGGVNKVHQDVLKNMIDSGKLVGPDVAETDQFIAWQNITKRHASSFAIIEGSIWRQIAEPCYTSQVYRGDPCLQTRSADFYEQMRNGYVSPEKWADFMKEGRSFSPLERERAYNHARRVAAAHGVPPDIVTLPRIDVLFSNMPIGDFDALEFERVSRLLVYDVADAFSKVAYGRRTDFFLQLPSEVATSFFEARDALVGMNARNGITQAEENAMCGLVEAVRLATRQGQSFVSRMSMDLETVDAIFEDWFSRNVSIESVVKMQIPRSPK